MFRLIGLTKLNFLTAKRLIVSELLHHICHGISGHQGMFSSLMMGCVVGCLAHCVGTCALCVSGSTVAASFFSHSMQVLARHAGPALMLFSLSLFSLPTGA